MAGETTDAKNASREEQLSPRQAQLWDFLKRERVGDKLLFTANHTREFMRVSDVRKDVMVWDLLRRLEGKEFIGRKRGKPGEGITISFDVKAGANNGSRPGRKSSRHKGGKQGVDKRPKKVSEKHVLARIDGDIAEIEREIKKLRADLAAKKTLRKQVTELFEGE